MSYLVLARKYRPQNFAEVLGQDHVTRTLRNAIQSDRVAHAYLFAGPRGVGKTSIARILAKAINCEAGPEKAPCNACGPCKEITSGTAVDVIEIDAASNRGIDSVRELREGVRYAPARCRRKVYIIDEVHMLTDEASNALLKTLEEPPSHIVFLFATTEPHELLPTILSRCQRFDLRRLANQQLSAQLSKILEAEGVGMEAPAIELVARLSDGGMRDALSLVDLVSSSLGRDTKKEPITEAEVASLAGVAGRELVEEALSAIAQADGSKALSCVARLYEYGSDVRRFYGELLEALRDALVLKSVKDAGNFIDLSETAQKRLLGIFEGWDAARIDQLFLLLQGGEAALLRSPHQRIVLEALLLRMSEVKDLLSVAALEDRLARLEEGGGARPPAAGGGGMGLPAVSPPAGTGPARGGPAPARSASGSSGAASVLAEVFSGVRLKSALTLLSLVEQSPGNFVLAPQDEGSMKKLGSIVDQAELSQAAQKVGEALSTRSGQLVRVVLSKEPLAPVSAPAAGGAPSVAGSPAQQQARSGTEMRDAARKDPVVARVLEKFAVEEVGFRPTSKE